MKKCPYCAEKIQDAAIVCRYCGRDLTDATPKPAAPISQTIAPRVEAVPKVEPIPETAVTVAPPTVSQAEAAPVTNPVPQPAMSSAEPIPAIAPLPMPAVPESGPVALVSSGSRKKRARTRIPPRLKVINLVFLGLIVLVVLALLLRPVFDSMAASSRQTRQETFSEQAVEVDRVLGPFSTATAAVAHKQITDPITTDLWLLFGPETIVLPHNAEDAYVVKACPGFSENQYLFEATFINPYAASESSWDFGLIFNSGYSGDYRLVIRSQGSWSFHSHDPSKPKEEFGEYFSGGKIGSLKLAADERNVFRFIADGDTGYLYVNDVSYGAIDLSPIRRIISTCILTGAYYTDEITGKATRVENIQFWVFNRP